MNLDSIFAQIKQVMHGSAGAKFSFGNPMNVGDLSVIPVAKISFGFGGGGGSSADKKKKDSKKASPDQEQKPQDSEQSSPKQPKQPEFGGGGGGGIKTEPIGIYAIKGDKIKFYPIVTVREIVTTIGIAIILLYKIRKLQRKRK